jgi:ABC-type multidrug transport system fused ATPase/permease subunit
MKLLLKTVLQNRRHYLLMVFTLISMLSMTIASQLEILSIGVLTNSGSDFFKLFSPGANEVTFEQVQEKWASIDTLNSGKITKEAASDFLSKGQDPNILSRFINYVDELFDFSTSIGILICVLLTIAVFKALSIYGSKFFTQVVSIRVSRDLRQRYFEYIQKLPMSFYQKHNIGSLSSRVVGDATVVASSINSALINYIQTPFLFISNLIICVYLSWKLSVVIFLGLPLLFFPIIFLAKKVKKVSRKMQKNQESFTSLLIDFLAGIQTVKIFSMEPFSIKKYKQQNDQMAQLEEKNAKYNSIARPILHTIGGVFLGAVLFLGVYVFEMQISSLIVFCGLVFQLYEPIKKFGEENSHIQRGVVAAERMFEVLNLLPDIQDNRNAIDLKGPIETIEFDNVWFRYEDDWILKGVSFKIEKGQSFAIVGPTGSGKSTIVQLLPRLYEIQKGNILINGRPLNAYTQKSIRENMAFVSQKPFLFLDTIKENIAFGRPFKDEEIIFAAKQAHADEFIDKLCDKYETMIAESGKNLSGGQQQRLAIARALIKKSPILIMDEATSALDAISENRIKLAIKELKGKITQIIIAHRLSTIEDADNILYLDRGEKVAMGPKEELLRVCPQFKTMWDLMYMQTN